MSPNEAHAFALSLAATLMVVIVVFRDGDGTLGVMPADEYDGEPETVVRHVDPFQQPSCT